MQFKKEVGIETGLKEDIPVWSNLLKERTKDGLPKYAVFNRECNLELRISSKGGYVYEEHLPRQLDENYDDVREKLKGRMPLLELKTGPGFVALLLLVSVLLTTPIFGINAFTLFTFLYLLFYYELIYKDKEVVLTASLDDYQKLPKGSYILLPLHKKPAKVKGLLLFNWVDGIYCTENGEMDCATYEIASEKVYWGAASYWL